MTTHPDPAQFTTDAAVGAAAAHRRQRHDGWTPERQRIFLEAVADGHIVEAACRLAGMAVSSAYSFRRRAAGAAFDLGWRAANLLAREHVADRLLARAIDGQRETVTRPNGDVIERLRFDNRLATAMLARLDRQAEQLDAPTAPARLVAGDFDAYLDLVGSAASPARAGLFLAGLTTSDHPDLAPLAALARADRFLRAGAEPAAADLDPAARAGWTAEQWARAEAAGLLRLAPPPPEPAPAAPLPPLHEADPVWWDDEHNEFRTDLPPPPGEDEIELHDSRYGDDDYERPLTAHEDELMHAAREAGLAEERKVDEQRRLAWFAQVEATIAAAEATGWRRPPPLADEEDEEDEREDTVLDEADMAPARGRADPAVRW